MGNKFWVLICANWTFILGRFDRNRLWFFLLVAVGTRIYILPDFTVTGLADPSIV